MSLAPPGHDPPANVNTDTNTNTKGASAGPWLSKTCQNCFSLKIRCDRTQRQDICDRCARLGKHCVFRPARRRDNSARRDSRIQALEQQVQDLLRLQRPGPVTQQPLPEPAATGVSTAPKDARDGDARARSHGGGSGDGDGDGDRAGDVVDQDIVSMERAETLVDMYKTDMMPHFPFVVVPPHVDGRVLRNTKPFLFLAIVSVACFHSLETQDRLCNCFKYLVSDKVLLGGDDCLKLEYLQGLLIVLAWNQYHGRSKYYSQYLQLAISIAVDMRLDRKSIHHKSANAGSKRNPVSEKVPAPNWGPEEQRAAAGIFYISSTISRLFDKMNTFPCTPTIEEGTLALRDEAEFRTDKDLYHVIRLQQIIERIDKVSTTPGSDADVQSAYLCVRSELEEFRIHMCSDVSDSHLLFTQFHTAKLFLYQVVYFERNLQQSPALHLDILCEGLEGAKSFLDLYLWLPPKSEMALTNTEWIQLSFGVTQAAKFAVISREPGVELQTRDLRHRLNIDNVFRHLALRIGALVGRAGEGNKSKDIFSYYEHRVRLIQKWYERMIRATATNTSASRATATHKELPQNTNDNHHNQGISPLPSHSSYVSMPSATSSHVPVSATFSHQQPQSYTQSRPYQQEPLQATAYQSMPQQSSIGDMGLTPMSDYSSYSPVPTIAYSDLINAQGWGNMFTIPMENEAIFDISQGYGLGMASPPSEASWDSSSTK